MSNPQQFLLTVQRMCTSPEADLVSGWSAVVAEEDLPKIELALAAEATRLAMQDCPIDDIRAMTLVEIDAWRKDETNG
jgi:hypothetical protein